MRIDATAPAGMPTDFVIPAKAGIQTTIDPAVNDELQRSPTTEACSDDRPSKTATCLDPRLRGDDERMGRARSASGLIALFFFLFLSTSAFAVNPEEMLTNPVLEARARVLSQGLRCLVCQNQSIDDSDAGLARDLRVLLRERLTAGDNDEQAVAYIVNRYGNFVLLKPPFQWNTALLWLAPALLLLLAVGGFYSYLSRGMKRPESAALDADDEARLAQLLEDGPNR